MPPQRPEPGSPVDWLRHARSNLRLARGKGSDILRDHLCFEAQQAGEKALKSVLVAFGVNFPKTHDLETLIALLKKSGRKFPERLLASVTLSDFAVTARYPGRSEEPTQQELKRAVHLASSLIRWASREISTITGSKKLR